MLLKSKMEASVTILFQVPLLYLLMSSKTTSLFIEFKYNWKCKYDFRWCVIDMKGFLSSKCIDKFPALEGKIQISFYFIIEYKLWPNIAHIH